MFTYTVIELSDCDTSNNAPIGRHSGILVILLDQGVFWCHLAYRHIPFPSQHLSEQETLQVGDILIGGREGPEVCSHL